MWAAYAAVIDGLIGCVVRGWTVISLIRAIPVLGLVDYRLSLHVWLLSVCAWMAQTAGLVLVLAALVVSGQGLLLFIVPVLKLGLACTGLMTLYKERAVCGNQDRVVLSVRGWPARRVPAARHTRPVAFGLSVFWPRLFAEILAEDRKALDDENLGITMTTNPIGSVPAGAVPGGPAAAVVAVNVALQH